MNTKQYFREIRFVYPDYCGNNLLLYGFSFVGNEKMDEHDFATSISTVKDDDAISRRVLMFIIVLLLVILGLYWLVEHLVKGNCSEGFSHGNNRGWLIFGDLVGTTTIVTN